MTDIAEAMKRFEPEAGASDLNQMVLAFGAALGRAGLNDEADELLGWARKLDIDLANPREERNLLDALRAIRDSAGKLADIVYQNRSRLTEHLGQ